MHKGEKATFSQSKRILTTLVVSMVAWVGGNCAVAQEIPTTGAEASPASKPLNIANPTVLQPLTDDEATKAAAASEAAVTDPSGTAPQEGTPSTGSKPEVIRKAVVGGSVLTDPTAAKEEIRPAQLPGAASLGNPLIPQDVNGMPIQPPLSTPVPSSTSRVGRRSPITSSTPFSDEQKRDDGPVVLGSDLEPVRADTELASDELSPEALNPPEVESADPWVFGLEVATLFDDNIRLSNNDAQEDFSFLLNASVAYQLGDVRRKRGSWARVAYKATGIAFVKEDEENSVDHDLQAGIQKRWGSLALLMEGRYRRLSGATPDLGDRVQRDDYQAKAGGSYDLGGRTFVEAYTTYNAVRYGEPTLADYDEWVAEGFAGYEVSGRTRVSAGGAVGRLKVAGMGTQNFQRALVKVDRLKTGALGLTAKAGAEFRQTPQGDKITPVFSASADWEPVEDSTRLTAEIFQETLASGALAGENYTRTGGAVRLLQQIGDRFSAGLEAGYEHLSYGETASGEASGRSDDYFFAKPSLRYEFAARRRAEIFYSFRADDSSVDDFSFTANQWGLSFGLDF